MPAGSQPDRLRSAAPREIAAEPRNTRFRVRARRPLAHDGQEASGEDHMGEGGVTEPDYY